MRSKLKSLVVIRERAESRAKRRLNVERKRVLDCRRDVDEAQAMLTKARRELHAIDQDLVRSAQVPLHRFQAARNHLDGLREEFEKFCGHARRAQSALSLAELGRSEAADLLLRAGIRLENARLREAERRCRCDAIEAARQEEISIESWFLRLQ